MAASDFALNSELWELRCTETVGDAHPRGFVFIYILYVYPYCATCGGYGDQQEGGESGGSEEYVFALSFLF